MHWLQVQLGKILVDYTTASNTVNEFQIKNIVQQGYKYVVNSLGPRNPRHMFKSSAAPLAIKSDTYEQCPRRA